MGGGFYALRQKRVSTCFHSLEGLSSPGLSVASCSFVD